MIHASHLEAIPTEHYVFVFITIFLEAPSALCRVVNCVPSPNKIACSFGDREGQTGGPYWPIQTFSFLGKRNDLRIRWRLFPSMGLKGKASSFVHLPRDGWRMLSSWGPASEEGCALALDKSQIPIWTDLIRTDLHGPRSKHCGQILELSKANFTTQLNLVHKLELEVSRNRSALNRDTFWSTKAAYKLYRGMHAQT